MSVAAVNMDLRVNLDVRGAHLRYVRRGAPGLSRHPAPGGFTYVSPEGRRVRDVATLKRIASLAIPPAWTQVWICPDEHGHIQATGRDARNRLQYRYHARWRSRRDETKFGHMLAFARALPRLRARVEADLARPGLPREKVVATVVRLLETTLIRVGNREYARANRHYGLTTLRDGHVDITGSRLRFHFRGKSGKDHQVALSDSRLARIVRQCRDIPGYELFQYMDEEGRHQPIDSSDVNEYIRSATGKPGGEVFTAKDFRTWAGTVLAAQALRELEMATAGAKRKKNVLRAVEQVAERLGNTATVCRKSYIHPAVLDSYLEGETVKVLRRGPARRGGTSMRLPADEAAVLALLKRRLADERRPDRLERLLKKSLEAGRSGPREPSRRAPSRQAGAADAPSA